MTSFSATIPLIFLYYFFYDIAYSPMLVAYTLEILPYKIRAKGFAVMVCTFFFSSLTICTLTLYSLEHRRYVNRRFQPICESLGDTSHWMVVLHRILRVAHHRARIRRDLHRGNQRLVRSFRA